jgi:hypothetical protein
MKLELNLSNGKSAKNLKKIGKALAYFWNKSYRFFFFVFFLALMSVGAYVWHRNLLTDNIWSEEQKAQYLSAQGKGVSFNQKDFDRLAENVLQRKAIFEADPPQIKNIFLPYK